MSARSGTARRPTVPAERTVGHDRVLRAVARDENEVVAGQRALSGHGGGSSYPWTTNSSARMRSILRTAGWSTSADTESSQKSVSLGALAEGHLVIEQGGGGRDVLVRGRVDDDGGDPSAAAGRCLRISVGLGSSSRAASIWLIRSLTRGRHRVAATAPFGYPSRRPAGGGPSFGAGLGPPGKAGPARASGLVGPAPSG